MRRIVVLLFMGILLVSGTGCSPSTTNERKEPRTSVKVTPTPGPAVLHFSREGGVAGLCDEMTIYASGLIEYRTCGRPTRTAILTVEERKTLEKWLSTLSAFTFRHSDILSGQDSLVRRLEFKGAGSASPAEDQQQELLAWCEKIYSELAGQPQPGTLTTGAGQVVETINQQVIVILPDEGQHDLILVTPETRFSWADDKPATISDVRPGVRIKVQGKVLGAGGLQAETVTIVSEGS